MERRPGPGPTGKPGRASIAAWTAFGRMLERNELVRSTINPEALAVVNSVFLKYLIPCALTLLIGNSFFGAAWNRRLRAQNKPFPS